MFDGRPIKSLEIFYCLISRLTSHSKRIEEEAGRKGKLNKELQKSIDKNELVLLLRKNFFKQVEMADMKSYRQNGEAERVQTLFSLFSYEF